MIVSEVYMFDVLFVLNNDKISGSEVTILYPNISYINLTWIFYQACEIKLISKCTFLSCTSLLIQGYLAK